MHKIKFVLGDWSNDGHGKKEEFIVESSVPVKELREIHFKSKEVLGFDIGDLCSEYGVNWISKILYHKLQDILKWKVDEDIDEKYWEETKDRFYLESVEELLNIWLDCLKCIDSSITLTVCDRKEYPTMHFYGYDKNKRHLNVPGYGLFE